MPRFFIAIPLPDKARDRLVAIQPPAIPGMRLVGREELHLTSHFLGEVAPEKIALVRTALATVKMMAFTVDLKGIGRFASERHVQVLWAGVEANSALTVLHRSIASVLAEAIGFQPEQRPYTPHVTLARLDAPAPPDALDRYMEENNDFVVPSVPLDQFALYSSDFAGNVPKYQQVAVFPLLGQPDHANMTIDEYCAEFTALRWPKAGETAVDELRRLPELVKAIHDRFARPTPEESQWLLDHMEDKRQRYFVSVVLEAAVSIDERFFLPLIKAGVYEVDPSFNRQFIEPAVKHFGLRRVKEALLEIINNGSTFEEAGAINALYWTGMKLKFPPDAPKLTVEYATPESRAAYESLADIRQRIALRLLELFVTTDSVDVQRSIIPSLGLDPTAYPDSHRPLVSKAIAIARSHGDDYIRHRVEVQLGNERLLRPIPQREPAKGQTPPKKRW